MKRERTSQREEREGERKNYARKYPCSSSVANVQFDSSRSFQCHSLSPSFPFYLSFSLSFPLLLKFLHTHFTTISDTLIVRTPKYVIFSRSNCTGHGNFEGFPPL